MEGEQVKKQRAVLRGRLTRMMNFVSSEQFEGANVTELKERRDTVSKIFCEFNELSLSIDIPEEYMNQFEKDYFSVKGALQQRIDFEVIKSEKKVSVTDFDIKCQVAPIKLPTFNGDLCAWNSFYALFESVIHNNGALDDVRRFQILKSSLESEPLNLIAGLDVCAANYAVALNLLIKTYQKNKHVAFYHIKRFFDCPLDYSSAGFKNMVNTTRSVIHALNGCDINTESWDPILLYVLLSKLDKQTKNLWELQDNSEEFVKLGVFLQFLEKQALILRDESENEPVDVHRLSIRNFQSSRTSGSPNGTKCKQCGYKHKYGRCPAWRKKCNKCDEFNHFAVCCPGKVAVVETTEEENQVGSLECFSINEVDNKCESQWFQPIDVDGVSVVFKLDTGADTSVLPFKLVKQLKMRLQKSDCRAVTYTGQKIPLSGMTTAKCCLKGKCFVIKFVVADLDKPPLLGLPDCLRFGLIKRVAVFSCIDLLERNKDVFGGLGKFPFLHTIRVTDEFQPFVAAVRRVPYALHDRLKNKLIEMETSGIIRKVEHPTAVVNPVVVVEKKNGDLRICLDMRRLNNFVMREHFNIPTLEDISRTLEGKSVFTVLDLKDGYYHVPLDDSSADLCTFGTIFGRYQFRRMPFGIRSAPEIFQKHMSRLFGDIPGVCAYFDDLLVAGATQEEHDKSLEMVFDRARTYNVRFNGKKIQYKKESVRYLGQIFSDKGISVDPQYVTAVEKLPEPENKNDLLRILGIVKYISRFISNMSEVTAPLRDLTRNDVEWRWTDVHIRAFQTLKDMTIKAPVLAYFNPAKDIEVHVDASKSGLGACLIQEGRPIGFASRSLTPTEQRYAVIEREMLALHFGVQKFHQFIYGKKFLLITDHKPLVGIHHKDLNSLSPRLQRIRLKLLNYDFTISHKPGRDMLLPDVLSRLTLSTTEPASNIEFVVHEFMKSLPISTRQREKFLNAMDKDRDMRKLKTFIVEGWPRKVPSGLSLYPKDGLALCEGLIIWDNRVVVPLELRREMLEILHSSHVGIGKCKQRARQTIIWPKINQDIEVYVGNCVVCQRYNRKNVKEPMLSHPLPSRPWQQLFIDIMTYKCQDYLIVVDSYSLWIEVVLLNKKTSQELVGKLKAIFAKFGIPDTLTCDNVPFASEYFKKFANDYCFDIITRSPNYPQSNSYGERGVGIIKTMFKKVDEEGTDIFLALLEHRNTPITHLNLSPAQLLMNRVCRTKLPTTIEALKPKLNENVPEKLVKKQEVAKKHYDPGSQPLKQLEVEDLVWIEYPNEDRWHAGRILEVLEEPRSYSVEDMDSGRIVRRNRRQLRLRFVDQPQPVHQREKEEEENPIRKRREGKMPDKFKDYYLYKS